MFWGIAFFVLSILFVQPVAAANMEIDHNAELNKVCKPMNCVVPVPTLVDPYEDLIKIDQDFYLTGLTWNNTKIYIYVDDIYQGEATVIDDDDSNTANFYYLIENNSLLEGQHEWKVIAWTETMRKRSYVSAENNFIIEDYFIAPQLDRITVDIDNNRWLVGAAGNNSIVSVYVDNVYQGETRTDGNFNYNLGNLSPGLHTFYTVARDANTGKLSKWSNLLSEQILEIDAPVEEPVIPEEPEEPVIPEEEIISEESIEELDELTELEEISQPEDLDQEEQISSISEEYDNEVTIISEEDDTNVSVSELEDSDIEVGVISEEESQDQLVVDAQKSELETIVAEEGERENSSATEELQPATPSIEDEEIIMEELSLAEKQGRNRKVGIWLLIILIVIVVASTFLSGKKNNSRQKEKSEEDDTDSHQGNLFNRE